MEDDVKPSALMPETPEDAKGAMLYGRPLLDYPKEELAVALVHYAKQAQEAEREALMMKYPLMRWATVDPGGDEA